MYACKPYDDLLELILRYGKLEKNRTGVDTLSIFGVTCEYNISKEIPIITKRKLAINGLLGELCWILSGSTNYKDAEKLGCNFWSLWGELPNIENSEFYIRTGYPKGYLGPIYGFQLRNFNGDYLEYIKSGELVGGIDQFYNLICNLRKNPGERRSIVSYWNPCQIHLGRLPPCHRSFQIKIVNGLLDILVDQRSADVPIGVPFNLGFYSCLAYLIGLEVNAKPNKLIHNIGDAHIYVDQIDGVNEYLKADHCGYSPIVKVEKAINLRYNPKNFSIENYNPSKMIKIPVAI